MVYYLSWQPQQLPPLPTEWLRYLSAQRVEKVQAYHFEKDRTAGAYAYLLLRYALYREYGLVQLPAWQEGENGKPQLADGLCHFNISHCAVACACALDSTPVGVDVQEFCPVRENVVRRVCSQAERQLLTCSDNAEKLFAALWTGKEAYGKYTGRGIGYDLQSVGFCTDGVLPCSVRTQEYTVHTRLQEHFSLSVCARQDLTVQAVGLQELLSVLPCLLPRC